MLRFVVWISSLLFLTVQCIPEYANLIPNGLKVPDPCNASRVWLGVGHQNSTGTGERNLFGEDFEKNGSKWTEELCRMDSDMDNKTNGAELGDPDCTWSIGDVSTTSTELSHPGVCEPIDHPDCASINTFLECLDTNTTIMSPPECLSHNDTDDSISPCEGRRKVRDRQNKITYCCEDGYRPVGRRTVSGTSQVDFTCRCVSEEEYCKDFPLFC